MSLFTLKLTPGQGPIVNAAIGVSVSRRQALTAAGETVPGYQKVRALIDTGASGTCVDPDVLAPLNLTPKGRIPVNTPSTGGTPHQADQYDVSLAIPGNAGQPPLMMPIIPVISASLRIQGIDALIGRDVLGRCFLAYDGVSGLFTIAF